MRFCLIILTLFTFSALGQEFKAELTTDKEISIGKPSRINLVFTYPAHKEPPTILAPDSGKIINQVLEVTQVSQPEINGTGYTNELTVQISLVSWDTGYHAIPPFKALYLGDTFRTDPLLIHNPDIPVDINKAPKDIRKIYDSEWTWKDRLKAFLDEYLWHILGAIILLIQIIVLIKYLSKPKKKKDSLLPDLPPYDLAMMQLEQLEEKRLWQSGKNKEFHIELSDILRQYIEGRFQVTAFELTTDQILQNLRFSEMESGPKRVLREIFKMNDLVKFAKAMPTPQENESILESARHFIHQTKQNIIPEKAITKHV